MLCLVRLKLKGTHLILRFLCFVIKFSFLNVVISRICGSNEVVLNLHRLVVFPVLNNPVGAVFGAVDPNELSKCILNL